MSSGLRTPTSRVTKPWEHRGMCVSAVSKQHFGRTWSNTMSGFHLTPSMCTRRSDCVILKIFFLFYLHLPSSWQLIVCKKMKRKLLTAWKKTMSFTLLYPSSPKGLELSEIPHGKTFPLASTQCQTILRKKNFLDWTTHCSVGKCHVLENRRVNC